MKVIKALLIFCLLTVSFVNAAQQTTNHNNIDDEISKIASHIQALQFFSENIPQERVYLHFDNTSYFQGDNIWFAAYVVTSGDHQLSPLSRTLYVELLNPGGEIIDRRILRVESGRAHGEFTLNHTPFYSGFFEVRAYTRYMLNFGEETIFSRLLPVFDRPTVEGNFEEREMLSEQQRRWSSRPMLREHPISGDRVNVRFFPEGGNLVQGVASRVAFEVTDAIGNPIDVSGVVRNAQGQVLGQISTQHEGRGVFTYTPTGATTRRQRDVAEVEHLGRTFRFDLPEALPQGVVMEIDNLSSRESIGITLRRGINTPAQLFGVALLSGDILQSHHLVYTSESEISFEIEPPQFSGVSRIVLFDSNGNIVSDRLIFTNTNEFLTIKATTEQPAFQPFEPVEMLFSITDADERPIQTTFSLSVRDGTNEIEGTHSIMTELLLMSEIRGFVRNPSFYFDISTSLNDRMTYLDQLLMVQGWRRHSWRQMAGIEEIDLQHLPEQGIVTRGRVISAVRERPQPNVDVALALMRTTEAGTEGTTFSTVTDSLGRFYFIADVEGRWDMGVSILSDRRRPPNHRILFDRVFSPSPRRFSLAELQFSVVENLEDEAIDDLFDDDIDSFFAAFQDSLARLGLDERIHLLPEVTVRARRSNVYRARSTSVVRYDVSDERDNLMDRGIVIGDCIHRLLRNVNTEFSTQGLRSGRMLMLYRGRLVLFVINYEPVEWNEMSLFRYRTVPISSIRAIYINTDASVIAQFMYPTPDLIFVSRFMGAAIFIETYPEGHITFDGGRGGRNTRLDGYSAQKEFYSPNHTALPPESDYRRTLYWNPNVTTDENGITNVRFFNNSRNSNFTISAETVTNEGVIGVLR